MYVCVYIYIYIYDTALSIYLFVYLSICTASLGKLSSRSGTRHDGGGGRATPLKRLCTWLTR